MRGKSSVADGSGERLIVTLVLAGIGKGELGDRTVEDGACAEVANCALDLPPTAPTERAP